MAGYVKNIVITLTRQILGLIIGLIAIALVARVLGVEEQGKYTILILIPLTLLNFMNLGIVPATIYWVGKKLFPLSDIYQTNKIIALLFSGIAIILGILFWVLFEEKYLEGIHIDEFFGILVCLPFLFLNYFFYSIFQGREDFESYNSILLINQIVLVIALVTAIVIFDFGLLGAGLSFTISHIITLVSIYYYFQKRKHNINGGKFSKAYFDKGILYGFKLYASNLLAFVNYRADLFLISYFLDFTSVGIYAIAVAIIERLWIIPGAISNVLYARISNLDSSSTQNNITSISTRNMLPVVVFFTLLLLLTSHIIIPIIFGVEYLASVEPLFYLFPGIILGAVAKPISNDFSGRGRAEINVYVALFTVLINIILNIILIPIYGIVGAAIATSISYSFNAIAKSIVFSKINGVKLINLLIIQKEDIVLYQSIYKKYLAKK